MKFDVCVIGAGPAGMFCALQLARMGAGVGVIEKQSAPGYKACGGGLTPAAFQLLCFELQSVAPYISSEFEPCRSLRVISPRGETVVSNAAPFMYVGERRRWQPQMIDVLSQQNIPVLFSQRCRAIGAQHVILQSGKRIDFDFLVAADGPRSLIRQRLKVSSGVSSMARQLVISKTHLIGSAVSGHLPAVWFDYERFGAGYGWAFPFEDEMRLGCSVPCDTHSNGQLNRAFSSWLSRLRVPHRAGRLESGSIGCTYVGHRMGRIFLVGDAAGLASPVSGEGIWQAIVSGREVAKEIAIPGYVSGEIATLSKRHHRIFNLLTHPIIGSVLYRHTGRLMRISPLARYALKRFS